MAKKTVQTNTVKGISIPSIRRPILEALAEAPDDVFGHAIERLGGLDWHLNDVIRGFSAEASESAQRITSAVQDHQAAVAAKADAGTDAAAVQTAAPAPKVTKTSSAKKKSARQK